MDDRVETVHLQTGSYVYIFETDEILPNDGFLLDKVLGLKEFAGTAQGMGLETVWWDGSDHPIDNVSPEELQHRADFVRRLLGIPKPAAKEIDNMPKKLIVAVQRGEKGR